MTASFFHFNSLKPFVKEKRVSTNGAVGMHELLVRSGYLRKKMKVDIYLPANYHQFEPTFYPALFINDGQDMQQLRLVDTLTRMSSLGEIPSIIVVAIHASDRMQEYGVAGKPDYMKRGNSADRYAHFMIQELIPYIYKHYRCLKQAEDNAIAGFSLGGLSAFDLAWHYSKWFRRVGVFSGSFWWRDKAFVETDPDAHRIIHKVVDESEPRSGLRFWFQVGTEDEQSDRNNNGVIDAIDDTLDLMSSLRKKGYSQDDITYREIVGGEHNFDTWAAVFPDFLRWAFGDVKSLAEKSA